MTATAKIDLLYFNAGGGHRAAATALESLIGGQNRPWQIRLVNLNEILLSTDILKKVFGLGLEDIYNLLLRKGWTLGSTQLLPLMHLLIRMFHGREVQLISEYWRRDTPDMVVSLIPNFNRAIHEGLRACTREAPLVTILTDLADYPPHFWMEPVPQYLICGTDQAVKQARAMGHSREVIYATSGMILRPDFYDAKPADVAAERIRLGLKPDLPTGLVLFGGYGAPQMLDIARRMGQCRRPVQLILICGHNRKLAARLAQLQTSMPMHVEGFTREVPYFMQLADFFIGKPGPGSISEALLMHLPVIVECNAWTLPQERYNATWVEELQVGVALNNFRRIGEAVTTMLESGQLESFKKNTFAIENRAVFEIPDILAEILGRGPHC